MTTISWAAGTSGSWTTGANWSPAQVPGSGDDAVIDVDLAGAYVVTVGDAIVHSVTLDASSAELLSTGNLQVAGGLAIAAGTFEVAAGTVSATDPSNAGTIIESGGTLVLDGTYDAASLERIGGFSGTLDLIGTLVNTGGTLDGTNWSSLTLQGLGTIVGGTVTNPTGASNATLDGVTWRGFMGAGDGVVIRNGLTVVGQNGSSSGTIDLIGALSQGGALTFDGDQSLDNASVTSNFDGTIASDNHLTLGPGLQFAADGYGGTLALTGAGTIANQGTGIASGTIAFDDFPAVGHLDIAVAVFGNVGTLEALPIVQTLGAPGGHVVTLILGGSIDVSSAEFSNLAGGTITLTNGTLDVSVATAFSNDGLIAADGVSAGETITSPGVGGTIASADPGFIDLPGVVTGAGTITLLDNAEAEFGSAATGQTVDFLGGASSLILDQPVAFGGTIEGFATGETISLGVGATATGYADNELTMQADGGGTFDLRIIGTYDLADFVVVDSGSATTIGITCFAGGTRIATERGEVAVEELAAGDIVLTHFAGSRPVQWVGRRRVDCGRHQRPEQVWPVRIAAGAFATARPRRDLWLSPNHAVFADGVLIPVKYLIDGSSITQVSRDRVTYYHVELPCHDLLLAEGLEVESYLDTDNRAAFSNGGGAVTLFPDFAACRWEAEGCAPLVITGPALAAVRRRVAAAARDRALLGFKADPRRTPRQSGPAA
jgi:collagen type I alpha